MCPQESAEAISRGRACCAPLRAQKLAASAYDREGRDARAAMAAIMEGERYQEFLASQAFEPL